MMRTAVFVLVFAMSLAGCGGGGGGSNGGGGSSGSGAGSTQTGAGNVVFSPSSLNLTFPANVPQNFSVTLAPSDPTEFSKLSNDQSLYTELLDPQGIFHSSFIGAPFATALNSYSQGVQSQQFSPMYVVLSSGALSLSGSTPLTYAPGNYQGTLQVVACSDSACATQLPGSPWSWPYSLHVTSAPVTSILAGSGNTGSADGTGNAATFGGIGRMALGQDGTIYLTDTDNNTVRKVTPAGVVSTIAGNGHAGSTNGQGTAASFNIPVGIAIDSAGNIYVADSGNNLIRRISTSGIVGTLAGSGQAGSADGQGASASFNQPLDLAIDKSGNLYVADASVAAIRRVTASGAVSTIAANNQTSTSAGYGAPIGICLDSSDNIYTTDYDNIIYKTTQSGVVSRIAGTGPFAGAIDGPIAMSSFSNPSACTVDASDNIYIADSNRGLIRKIAPDGIVTTVVGTNVYFPTGVVVDGAGSIYVANGTNRQFGSQYSNTILKSTFP